jgi:hypothetical protein
MDLSYDVSFYNELISKTGKLIDEDPLLWATWEIEKIKESFDTIHEAINNASISENEKKWLLWKVFSNLLWDKKFDYTSFEGKINWIFRQFDLTFESIQNSIEMYEQYSEWLQSENEKLKEFISSVEEEKLSTKELSQFNNYKIMLSVLETSLWRINLSKDSALELSETMKITRPIFQSTLSSCLIEVAGQKTIDASIQMLSTLSWTVESLSNKLTKSTIETSKLALEAGTKPILSSSKIEENMLLLSNAFEELENRREQLLLN